jgi:hypothetical protein
MSIFRLFKSAVVLSIVLYFEGCGDKKNGNKKVSKGEIDEVRGSVNSSLDSCINLITGTPGAAKSIAEYKKIKTEFNDGLDELCKDGNNPTQKELEQFAKKFDEKMQKVQSSTIA